MCKDSIHMAVGTENSEWALYYIDTASMFYPILFWIFALHMIFFSSNALYYKIWCLVDRSSQRRAGTASRHDWARDCRKVKGVTDRLYSTACSYPIELSCYPNKIVAWSMYSIASTFNRGVLWKAWTIQLKVSGSSRLPTSKLRVSFLLRWN